MEYENKEQSPSPRSEPSGWEYAENLWIFGGDGPSPDGYLYDYVDFHEQGENNQLLHFDPSRVEWTNPECFGTYLFLAHVQPPL